MKILLLFLAVLLGSVAPALADNTAPSATATPAPAAKPAQSDADAARAKLLKQIRARGFKEKFLKGEIVWCRKESSMGTRFKQTLCLTEAEMAVKLKNEAALQQELDRKGPCVGDDCVQN